MYCTHSRLGKTLIVELSGRLDANTAVAFEEQCRQFLEPADQAVVLDLGRLDYVSSAGLRSILTLAKQLKTQRGSLRLCKASGVVREVLEVSGFLAIFPLIESPADVAPQHG